MLLIYIFRLKNILIFLSEFRDRINLKVEDIIINKVVNLSVYHLGLDLVSVFIIIFDKPFPKFYSVDNIKRILLNLASTSSIFLYFCKIKRIFAHM